MKPGKTISALIVATMAGYLIGLLFAPQKGSRTRRRILEKGEDSFEDMISDINNAVQEFREGLDKSCSTKEPAHKEYDK